LTDKDVSGDDSARKKLRTTLSDDERSTLTRILNKVKSPCGVQCAVCHDMEGGITPDGERIKDYAVLTATHGSGASNYDPEYAEYKRRGLDGDKTITPVKWKGNEENPFGLERKYDKNVGNE
jgi:hypothetical protein